ncbi:MAG: protein kinase domain-containing protein [Halanaerobiaceae bacterium]
MQILSVNNHHDFNVIELEDNNQRLIAEELFSDRKPRSRLIADILKAIEEIITERQKKINHSAYIKYADIRQIEGEYCLLRKGEKIYTPLASYIQGEEGGLDDIIDWMISLAEIACEAEKKDVKWEAITLQSLWIDPDGNLKFLDPDIVKLVRTYRPAEGLQPLEMYQPPELFQDKAWDMKARIYSAGIIFYYLVTGEKPFISSDKSDLVDEIMNSRPLEPVYINHNLSGELNQFIIKLINGDPDRRIIDWEEFIDGLKEIKKENLIYTSEEEREQFAVEADRKIKSLKRRKGLRIFWRKRGKIIAISLAVIAVFVVITLFSGSDPYITENTSPGQVVEYFYRAIDEQNISLLDETNNMDLKRLDNMVMETHVIKSMRQAYSTGGDEQEAEEQQVFGVKDIQFKESTNTVEPTYRANYRFFYHETKENGENDDDDIEIIRHEVEMEDILKLDKIEGKWQIVEIEGTLEYLIEGRTSELLN